MAKYVDYKVETWIRVKFDEDVDLQEVIQKLESGILPPDFGNEYDVEYENLTETEEFIRPIENDGQSTIEVYEGNNFQECIWDNSFDSERKRKKMTNKEKYEQLLKSIDWENYRLSGEECDEQHKYMDLCKVLHKKINDIQIQLMLLLHKDSVDMVDELIKIKTLLSLLNEEKLKSII